jgi:hypothetical protein
MTRSKTRWALAGFLALAALGGAAVLDIGSVTAEAASSVSPFAGNYIGAVPGSSNGFWAIAISDGGQITNSTSGSGRGKSSLSGRVSSDGTYSITVSETSSWYDERRNRTVWVTLRWTLAGNLEMVADGIVGTIHDGGSFSWFRQ